MLTTFPTLLMYSFYVPTALRVMLAVFFAWMAISHFTHKKAVGDEIDNKVRWVSHEMAVWLVGLVILFELAIALFLFVGAFTQIAAILAALAFAKMAWLRKSMPHYAPLPSSTFIVLAIVALSVLITGAGGFAFDLPL